MPFAMMDRMKTTLAAIFSVLISLQAMPARALPATSGNSPVQIQSAERASPARGVALGTHGEDQRYAAREAASPEAKKYRGGDVVVISASAVAIVLLVVLILILI
jgi:hypothetical protein